MVNILHLGRIGLQSLEPKDVTEFLTQAEFLHIADMLEARWCYDRTQAEKGMKGLHGRIKSRRHTDEAFNSIPLLALENIRRIMAFQIVKRLPHALKKRRPAFVAGVPNGAVSLGKEVAEILGVGFAEMEKREGKIYLTTQVGARDLLFVDDFCSHGTAMREAMRSVHLSQPDANILMYVAYLLSRGKRSFIPVEEVGIATILSVIKHEVKDWDSKKCDLCDLGSEPIDFKATPENWNLLMNSQK